MAKGKKSFYNNQDTNKQLAGEVETVPKSTEIEKESPAAVVKQPEHKSKDKKGQKYLRLDITNYHEYISLMAEHMTNTSGKYVSMTQYILRLIEADKQQNLELYEKLEQIEKMKRELV